MNPQRVRLGDVANFLTGFPFKSRDYSADGTGTKLLRGDNIGQGFLRWDKAKLWPDHFTGDYKKFELKSGDVVLAMDRPWIDAGLKCSVVSATDLPALLVQRVTRLRGTQNLDTGYLRYLIGSQEFTEHVHTVTTGTAVPHISGRDILAFEFDLPELKIQKDIAAALGALDDKIELNRRMSATLEEMARALYRSWFVDFDPVHARSLGQSPTHMDPATAALFPDSFGPEGLPKGWKMSTIGDVAETVGGATPKTKEPTFWDGQHRWATPRDLSKLGQPILFETDRTLTDEGLAKVSSGLSPAGTVLLSSRAPIGYVAIAQNPVAINQGFIALRETDQISSVEAYFWVQANMEAILANANGSTFQEISKKNFRPLPYVVAPGTVRQAFRDLAGAWFDRVSALCAESANLATLRDTLLPRLISGELRIRAAEKLVEETV